MRPLADGHDRVAGIETGNLFADLPERAPDELFTEFLHGAAFELQRIVSTGQCTPAGEWYDQDTAEWVVLLSGTATLRFETDDTSLEMRPGDYAQIPAHCRHRVESTHVDQPTVWLALHYRAAVG